LRSCPNSIGKNGLLFLGDANHDLAQSEEGDGVGDDHQVVESIGQLPNQIVGNQSAQEDEDQSDHGVNHGGSLGILLAEEEVGVDLAEQVPAQNGGEGEEEQADGHEDVAEGGAEHGAEGGLGQVGLADHGLSGGGAGSVQGAVSGVEGGDDNQSVEGEHHEGVDEHADHSDDALIVGVLHVGLSVSVGSGTHTGLIGEQAALGALADGGLDAGAEGTAQNGLRLEGVLEDHAEGGGDVLDAGHENHQTAEEEETGHDGDDLLGDGGQTLDAAQEDGGADGDQNQTDSPGGDAESGVEGGADGVGLHHAAEEAEGEDNSHGEEAGEELAEAALEGVGDVVDGAALDVAVLVHLAGVEGEGSLSVDGGHAQEGDDPHPEDGAGAAGEDGAGSADDVTGTDLSGNGGGQSLERGHAGGLLTAAQGQVAEDLLHAFAEAANLHELGADGVEQAYANQQEDEDIAGQVIVDVANDGIQGCFKILNECHNDFLQFFS